MGIVQGLMMSYGGKKGFVPGSNTVAYYKLDGNANDDSGNGNNGTATNVTWVDGILGSGAASFNGTNSTITKTGLSESFTTITISAWIKKKRNVNNERFVNLLNPSGLDIELSITTKGTNRNLAIVGYAGGWKFFGNCDTGIENNNRMYVTFVVGSNFNKLYINAVEKTLSYDQGNASSGIGTVSITQRGIGSNSNGIQFAQADIDEVIIENRARTAAEIKKYYTYALGRFGIQ